MSHLNIIVYLNPLPKQNRAEIGKGMWR